MKKSPLWYKKNHTIFSFLHNSTILSGKIMLYIVVKYPIQIIFWILINSVLQKYAHSTTSWDCKDFTVGNFYGCIPYCYFIHCKALLGSCKSHSADCLEAYEFPYNGRKCFNTSSIKKRCELVKEFKIHNTIIHNL